MACVPRPLLKTAIKQEEPRKSGALLSQGTGEAGLTGQRLRLSGRSLVCHLYCIGRHQLLADRRRDFTLAGAIYTYLIQRFESATPSDPGAVTAPGFEG